MSSKINNKIRAQVYRELANDTTGDGHAPNAVVSAKVLREVADQLDPSESVLSDNATIPGGWISTESELPNYEVRVLVYYEHHQRVDITFRTHTDKDGEHWQHGYEHYITHWMPLPEAPEEDGS